MSEGDPPAREPHEPALGWATICEEFPDLRLWAYRGELSDRFRELRRAAGTDGSDLSAWLTLRAELIRREDHEWQYAKQDPDRMMAALDDIVSPGCSGHDQAEYVCPGDLCARRARGEWGEAPICDLLDRTMRPAPGGADGP